jgi:DNA-binding Lrp family transcriptional regulator
VDEVQEAYSLTGEADYLVKLVVPNLETLSRVINEVFLPHRSVGRVQSSVVLDRVKESVKLPLRRPSVAERKTDVPKQRTPNRKTRTRT